MARDQVLPIAREAQGVTRPPAGDDVGNLPTAVHLEDFDESVAATAGSHVSPVRGDIERSGIPRMCRDGGELALFRHIPDSNEPIVSARGEDVTVAAPPSVVDVLHMTRKTDFRPLLELHELDVVSDVASQVSARGTQYRTPRYRQLSDELESPGVDGTLTSRRIRRCTEGEERYRQQCQAHRTELYLNM